MKVFSKLVLLISGLALAGCGNAQQINAHSLQTANRSVAFIKEHLPADQRTPFEAAYWLLREQIRSNDEFLKTIDGKSAEQLIALGKEHFSRRRAAGDKAYAEFENWEQMISHSERQRAGLEVGDKVDPRDKKGYPRVDYKMHAM